MSTAVIPREHTLTEVKHPDPLPGHPGRVLIIDPVADRLQKGDFVLGWEGDPRLALYLNVPERVWELWRLEHDGKYRRVALTLAERVHVADLVPSLVMFLVEHDQRRGYQPLADIAKADASAKRAADNRLEAWSEEAGSRLATALRKDGVDPLDVRLTGLPGARQRLEADQEAEESA